jgi:hypothetical protein
MAEEKRGRFGMEMRTGHLIKQTKDLLEKIKNKMENSGFEVEIEG